MPAQDTIFIKSLEVQTIIGIHPWEKATKQPVLFDLTLFLNTQPAALSGQLSDTVDYDKLCSEIIDYVSVQTTDLIETLAHNVANLILKNHNITQVTLSLHKPRALNHAADVILTITRTRCSKS